MTVNDRSRYIQENQLWFNSFAISHQFWDCTCAYNCFTFQDRHHTLLH